MVSGLASPPPGLGFGGFPMPKPPPDAVGNFVKGVGGGLKGVGAGAVSLGSSVVGAVALDLFFPQSTASSALSDLPAGFFDSGTEVEVEPRIEGDPPFTGGQGLGLAYRFRVRYDVYAGENPWITDKLSNERIRTGPIIGIIITGEGRDAYIEVAYTTLSGDTAYQFIDSGNYAGITFRNARFEYIIRTDGTSEEDDVNENGNPPNTILTVGISVISGILNPPSDWTPQPFTVGGYLGPAGGEFTGNTPITLPPSVGNGDLGSGALEGDVIGGGGTATGNTNQGSGAGSASGGAGAVGGSGAGGRGGIVGGGVINTGTSTTNTGDIPISGGGTAVGGGIGTGTGDLTGTGGLAGDSPITGTVGDIPIINGSGEQVDTLAPGGTTVLQPGVIPFPGETVGTQEVPGTIAQPTPLSEPIINTPNPPPEEQPEEEEPRIVPIPFELNGGDCCDEILGAIEALANDLECVIENICGEKDPIVYEFVKVDVFNDPEPNKVFNPSTDGLYEDVVISGHLRWVVNGLPTGDEHPIRRRQQVFLIPEWADGYDLYPSHGADLVSSIVYSTNSVVTPPE